MSIECDNLCFHSEQTCTYCKKNYDVSHEFYRARRQVNSNLVVGYLVKNKNGRIEGILNKSNHFFELAWIVDSTLEKVSP